MNRTKKIALITGANKGLGFQTAKQLAEQGIKVLMGARNKTKGEQATQQLLEEGWDVQFIWLDVSDEQSIIQAKTMIETAFGRLDILINNAGILLDLGQAPPDVSIQDFRTTLDINVVGPMTIIKYFLPLLKQSEGGRIVNVSSGLGSLTQNADPNYLYYPYKLIAYNTSKTAVNAITLAYAFALKDTAVKINSADPGFCQTDLNHNSGTKSPAEGAKIMVQLATIPADGPHGGFFDANGIVPW